MKPQSGLAGLFRAVGLVALAISLTGAAETYADELTLREDVARFYRPGEVLELGDMLKLESAGGGKLSQVSLEYNMLVSELEVDWLYDGEVIGHTVLPQGLRRQVDFTYGKPLPGKIGLRFRGTLGRIQVKAVSAVIEAAEGGRRPPEFDAAIRKSLFNDFHKSYEAFLRKRALAKLDSLVLEFAERTLRGVASESDLSLAFPTAEIRAKTCERRKQTALLEFEYLKQFRLECMAAFARAGFGEVDRPPLTAEEQKLLEEIKAFDCTAREERSPLSTRIKLPPHGRRRYLVRTFCLDSGRAIPDVGQKFKVVGTAESLRRRDLTRLIQEAAADPRRENRIQMEIWSDERTERTSRDRVQPRPGQQADPSEVTTLIAGIESDKLSVEASARFGFALTELRVENRTNKELEVDIGGAILDPVSNGGDTPQREVIAGIDEDLIPLVPALKDEAFWPAEQLWAELRAAKAVEEYFKHPTEENYDKAQEAVDYWEEVYKGDAEKVKELRDAVEAKRKETTPKPEPEIPEDS